MSKPFISPGDDLSQAEEALLMAAARGEGVDADGAEIRGSVLRVLLNGSRAEWGIAESGVRLLNAVIRDGLDFEGCTIAYPLLLSGVRMEPGQEVRSSCGIPA